MEVPNITVAFYVLTNGNVKAKMVQSSNVTSHHPRQCGTTNYWKKGLGRVRSVRSLVRAIGLVLILGLLSACSSSSGSKQSSSAPEPQKAPEVAQTGPKAKTKLTLATATQGGVFWPMGQEMASIWNQAIPEVEVTAITTGGTAENIQKLGFKEVELGFAVSGVVFYAATGAGDYKTLGKQESLRGVLALHPNVVHMVVRSSAGIKSLKDLKGKAWAPGARGSATEVNTRELMGAFSMDSGADLKAFYLGYDETVENMKAGKVDGATLAAGIGGKAVKDALTLGGWNLLSLTQAEVDAIVKQYPAYFPVTIPANTYTGQTTPVLSVAQASILVARADVSADLVYSFTKAFYEKLPALTEKVSAAKDISRDNGLKGITGVVPLHPGAEKYFKEVGVLK